MICHCNGKISVLWGFYVSDRQINLPQILYDFTTLFKLKLCFHGPNSTYLQLSKIGYLSGQVPRRWLVRGSPRCLYMYIYVQISRYNNRETYTTLHMHVPAWTFVTKILRCRGSNGDRPVPISSTRDCRGDTHRSSEWPQESNGDSPTSCTSYPQPELAHIRIYNH